MFARVKKSGRHEYLQIVENRRVGKKTVQRVISTIGRMDQLHAKGSIETLVRSLSRFSEKVLLILSNKSDVSASGKKIGPALIFERLWISLCVFDIPVCYFVSVLGYCFVGMSLFSNGSICGA